MPMNFPDSPTNGATFTSGGSTWTYFNPPGVWRASASPSGTITGTSVPITVPFAGKPAANAQVNVAMPIAITVAANLAGSVGFQNTICAATATFTINKISGGATTALGTVAFTTGGKTSFTLAGAGGALAIGDVLQVVAPGTQDTSLADLDITILALRA